MSVKRKRDDATGESSIDDSDAISQFIQLNNLSQWYLLTQDLIQKLKLQDLQTLVANEGVACFYSGNTVPLGNSEAYFHGVFGSWEHLDKKTAKYTNPQATVHLNDFSKVPKAEMKDHYKPGTVAIKQCRRFGDAANLESDDFTGRPGAVILMATDGQLVLGNPKNCRMNGELLFCEQLFANYLTADVFNFCDYEV